MTNGNQSSIWRWVLALVIVVGLFGPGALSAAPDADPNESGTDEATWDSESDPRQQDSPESDYPRQGWWCSPWCI